MEKPNFNINFKILKDDDPMPFGQHKGVPMHLVPARDLLWLHKNGYTNKSVRAYIIDHWEQLHTRAGIPIPPKMQRLPKKQ